jgi:AcrR family transcriptional regulator
MTVNHAEKLTPAAGTPAWWATRPARPAQRGRGRPPRSFDEIVVAAAALVDEVGTRRFNMRLLAEHLQTSTTTLYRHVAGKEELMAYVVDRLLAEIEAAEEMEEGAPRSWREAARRSAVEFHRVLAEHPKAVPLVVAQVPTGPHGMRLRERTISTLMGFGFSARLAARTYTTLAHYVIGFAVQQHGPGAPGSEDAAALGDYYRGLDRELYPSTIAAANALTTVPLEDEFLEGLEFILDGIERAHRRGTGPAV